MDATQIPAVFFDSLLDTESLDDFDGIGCDSECPHAGTCAKDDEEGGGWMRRILVVSILEPPTGPTERAARRTAQRAASKPYYTQFERRAARLAAQKARTQKPAPARRKTAAQGRAR